MKDAWLATKYHPIKEWDWRVEAVSLPARSELSFGEEASKQVLNDAKQSAAKRINAAFQLAWLKRKNRPIDVTCLDLGQAMLLHLPGEPFIEYQLAAICERDRSSDKSFAIIKREALTRVGGTDQCVSPEREAVIQKPRAVVEVRNTGDYDLLRTNSFFYEKGFITFARNTKTIICVAESGRRGTRKPSRKEPNASDDVIGNGLRISHPLLDKYDLLTEDVLRNNKIRARYNHCVISTPARNVQGKTMLFQVSQAARRQFATHYGRFSETKFSRGLQCKVAVIRGEEPVVISKLIRNLMHLGRLV
jgi:hypothetical protein